MRPFRNTFSLKSLLIAAFVLRSSTFVAAAQNLRPTFEIASVKPSPPQADPNTGTWSLPQTGRFTATHVTLALLLQLAFGVDSDQMVNKPSWFQTNLYDVNAKPEAGITMTREELQPRLQSLLEQRFHLRAHMETRVVRGYALIVAKGGPHLVPTQGDHFPGFRINVSQGQMRGMNWSMAQFAKYLTPAAGSPVVDQTGISGSYDISFNYEPHPEADGALPILSVALEQATGLSLKPGRIPAPVLVIESVDKIPTAD